MTYARFSPRRPIKSFQDLEVYQKLLGVSVAVAKRIIARNLCHAEFISASPANAGKETLKQVQGDTSQVQNDIPRKLVEIALELPVKIATAHSLRFSDQEKGIAILEEAMLGYNLLVVYLEQYRDIENGNIGTGAIEPEFFEEQIKTLLTVRFKVMHLQMSWRKFSKEKNA